MRGRCYNLNLTEQQLAKIAYAGLTSSIREKFAPYEFNGLAQLTRRAVSQEESLSQSRNRRYQQTAYADFEEDTDEDEINAVEWTKNTRPVFSPHVKNKERKYDFDLAHADDIFEQLLREKRIQLTPHHKIPSPEELKKLPMWCKWHGNPTHNTVDCITMRDQIQKAVDEGRLRAADVKKKMRVDGHPFPANTMFINTIGGGSAGFIRQYEKKREREEQAHAGRRQSVIDREDFDPHWACPFFQYCWDQGMKLPSIENCSECNKQQGGHYRAESSAQGARRRPIARHQDPTPPRQSASKRVSVYDRLGPINDEEEFDREYNQEYEYDQEDPDEQVGNEDQWCPSGLFSRSQKRRLQRMRCRELRGGNHRRDDQDDEPKPKKEWRPKVQSKVVRPEATVNMVTLLPQIAESADVGDLADSAEKESADTTPEILWSPESAVFEKPIGSDHLHLKALYLSGYINGSPMRRMLVDGGAAVNVMPVTTYRKLGKLPEELIKTDLTLKDYSGRSQNVCGATTVKITIGSKTIPTTFFVIEGKGAYTTLLGRD